MSLVEPVSFIKPHFFVVLYYPNGCWVKVTRRAVQHTERIGDVALDDRPCAALFEWVRTTPCTFHRPPDQPIRGMYDGLVDSGELSHPFQ